MGKQVGLHQVQGRWLHVGDEVLALHDAPVGVPANANLLQGLGGDEAEQDQRHQRDGDQNRQLGADSQTVEHRTPWSARDGMGRRRADRRRGS